MMHECNGELIPSGGGDNIPLIREKLTIRYNDYKKFGSDTTITFDK